MAKTYDHLWPEIVSFSNLLLAFRKAAKGKRGKAEVAEFEFHLEPNLFELQEALGKGDYLPGTYTSFYIHDPKKRLISAAPFRDRVVHHALCNVIEPIFERKFIFDTYANRVGKGTHRAHATGSPTSTHPASTRTGYHGVSTTAGSVTALPLRISKRAPWRGQITW